jgi:3-phosphoshikimate 1-carboxyvinyltransferase
MIYQISKESKFINGQIRLPASKSISNRLLILQALARQPFKIKNLSESKDTQVLAEALHSNQHVLDVGHAGTSMRFLTAYCSLEKGEWLVTGSERMQNRPIGKLVDALRTLGANITYDKKEGFPPLKIKGGSIKHNTVSIDGSISSQYITALLLIAPSLPKGLELQIEGKLVSEPYVQMTLDLMELMGIEYDWWDNKITIEYQEMKGSDVEVEADWSAASYWYEMAALAKEVDLAISGLDSDSYQGDAVVEPMFEEFGVFTRFENDTARISQLGEKTDFFSYDFIECPDLVQTMVVTCVLTNTPFKISGAETLRIKETDRIAALQNELAKFNAVIKETSEGVLEWDGKDDIYYNGQTIETYDDHRMAMSFAPAALLFNNIKIENPEVVVKSYPGFWKDLQKVGFTVNDG